MNAVEWLGIAAAVLTTGSLLPQVVKIIKSKSTGDISFRTYIMLFAGTVLWLVYGFLVHKLPIILANGASALLSFIIFYYKIREMRTPQSK